MQITSLNNKLPDNLGTISNTKELSVTFDDFLQASRNKTLAQKPNYLKAIPEGRESTSNYIFTCPMLSITKFKESSFIKGLEDGVLSINDLKTSFQELFDKFYSKFHKALSDEELDPTQKFQILLDENENLALADEPAAKEQILDVFSGKPELEVIFKKMQVVANLMQHPQVINEFTKAYQEDPNKALADFGKLFDTKFKDEVFILNFKKSNYEITFKKLDIREIKACIEKIKDDIELKLKKTLLDSNLSIEGGIKSEYDGTGKLKLIIPNNIPDEQRIIEETIYKNPRLKSLIKQVEYLTGIVQNPSVLPEYTRGFLTKSYQKITGDELEKFIVFK